MDLLCDDGLREVYVTLNSITGRIRDVNMLETAVEVVTSMSNLATLLRDINESDSDRRFESTLREVSVMLSETCDSLLRREWRDDINKRRYTMADIGFLVRNSILWAIHPLENLHKITMHVLPELVDLLSDFPKSDNGTDSYPTLKLASFNLYYTTMLAYLTESWEVTNSTYVYL